MAAAHAADPNACNAVIEAEGARALSGPVLLAIIATIQNDHLDIPPHEQWISVGAALQNILLAAEALGFAAKMVSGRRVRSPVLRSAFRLTENEHLVGLVMFGTASAEAAAKPALRRTVDQILSDWVPPVLSEILSHNLHWRGATDSTILESWKQIPQSAPFLLWATMVGSPCFAC